MFEAGGRVLYPRLFQLAVRVLGLRACKSARRRSSEVGLL